MKTENMKLKNMTVAQTGNQRKLTALAFAAVLAVLLGHRLVVYWQQRRPAAVSAVKPEP